MSTTTLTKPKAGEFRGRLAGVIYTDRALFETTAMSMGLTSDRERRPEWKPGIEVAVTIDGETLTGQVWARCPERGYVWVALDGGRFVALNTRYGGVYEQPRSATKIGRLAA